MLKLAQAIERPSILYLAVTRLLSIDVAKKEFLFAVSANDAEGAPFSNHGLTVRNGTCEGVGKVEGKVAFEPMTAVVEDGYDDLAARLAKEVEAWAVERKILPAGSIL